MDPSQTPKIGVYFLASQSTPACFPASEEQLKKEAAIQVFSNAILGEVEFKVKDGQKCLLIFTIADRNDLSMVANSLFSMTAAIKSRHVIALVFMKFTSEKVEDLLIKSGVTELLRFDVTEKAFGLKLRRYAKILEQEHKEKEEIASFHSDKLEAPKGMGISTFQVVVAEAWTGGEDFWLFRKKIYAKKYQNNWMIELIGPSPAVGSWENLGEHRWRWRTRPGFDFFDASPSSWEFRGNHPEYSWVLNRWAFSSENPALDLVRSGQVVYSRFRLKDSHTLEVAENSEFARTLFPKIQETYDHGRLKGHDHPADLRGLKGVDSASATEPATSASVAEHHVAEQTHWADKENSAHIADADWNLDDSNPNDNSKNAVSDSSNILMGAGALSDCGLKGKFKNSDAELLEYNEINSNLSVALDSGLAHIKEIVEISVGSENLGLPQSLRLKGVVTDVSDRESDGKVVAVFTMLPGSREEFRKIREAVDRRQKEIILFLKQAKGL